MAPALIWPHVVSDLLIAAAYFEAVVKAMTAATSVPTALMIGPLIPKALALPFADSITPRIDCGTARRPGQG
ncbi:MAG: hypothetical protein ABIO85_10690 [Sphingomicrobium sp.]